MKNPYTQAGYPKTVPGAPGAGQLAVEANNSWYDSTPENAAPNSAIPNMMVSIVLARIGLNSKGC